MADERTPPHRKPRLGRGLSSLIASSILPARRESQDGTYVSANDAAVRTGLADGVAPEGNTREIGIDQIAPNPYQPRRSFKPEELAELAASLTEQGVLQPLIVCQVRGGQDGKPYVLIAGERRLRAARQAGLTKVPCVIREATARQMLEWSLVENIQRADLNPIERATGYRDYMDRFGLSQGQAAERLGQARATVANYVRMLDLCGEVQQLLIDAALTFGHGKVLAGLAGEEPKQLAVARKIVAEGLSVRQAEALAAIVRLGSGQPDRALVVKPPGRAKPAYLLDLEQRLCQCVGTRVRILPSRAKHSGRIVVEYYSLDDFDRITGRLGLGAEGLAGPTA